VRREVEQDDPLAGQRLICGHVAAVGTDQGLTTQELHFSDEMICERETERTSQKEIEKTAIKFLAKLLSTSARRIEEFPSCSVSDVTFNIGSENLPNWKCYEKHERSIHSFIIFCSKTLIFGPIFRLLL